MAWRALLLEIDEIFHKKFFKKNGAVDIVKELLYEVITKNIVMKITVTGNSTELKWRVENDSRNSGKNRLMKNATEMVDGVIWYGENSILFRNFYCIYRRISWFSTKQFDH